MYDEDYGIEYYEWLAELDIIQIRNVEQERREFQTEQQKILDAYMEWYQTEGYLLDEK